MLSAREIVAAVLEEHYKAQRLPHPSNTVKWNLGIQEAEARIKAMIEKAMLEFTEERGG